MDIESAEAVHALKLAKPIERYLARARDELKKLGSLFLVEGADSAPEPLNLCRRGGVIVVVGIVLPIIHVDVR